MCQFMTHTHTHVSHCVLLQLGSRTRCGLEWESYETQDTEMCKADVKTVKLAWGEIPERPVSEPFIGNMPHPKFATHVTAAHPEP